MSKALDIITLGGRLVFHVFAALPEFLHQLISEGMREAWPRLTQAGSDSVGHRP